MMSDEEMAAAIAVALEPLAAVADSHPAFDSAYDEVHLRLMRLFDRIFDAGIKYGMHVEQDEHFLLHGGRYES